MDDKLFPDEERKELEKEVKILLERVGWYRAFQGGMKMMLEQMRQYRRQHLTNEEIYKPDNPEHQELIRDWDHMIKHLEDYTKMMDVSDN